MSDRDEKINNLACDVLNLSRNTLTVNLRFMDKAISMLKLIPLEGFNNIAVDGVSIGYDPVYVLKSYKAGKEIPVRQYLHMVFHCIFQHFYVSILVNQMAWNLACDIAVENMINELNIQCVYSERQNEQQKIILQIKNNVKCMTAEVIYRYFCDLNIDEKQLWEIRKVFFCDDHSIWYERKLRIDISIVGIDGLLYEKNDDDDLLSIEIEDNCDETQKANNKNSKGIDEIRENSFKEKISNEWKNVSRQMQMDLESFSKQRGEDAGSLIQNLNSINREEYDYESFLRKFAVYGEVMKINDDEFDYIFYTYGMELYKKMPLIEPLEYKDVKRIKEFVIAIDTSGSTSGKLVQTFVQKTYNILKQQENFFTRINIHIIQCDADIQENVKITNEEEFDNYIKKMEIHGLGGTDFRPVFSYVDKLIEEHEFSNLKGMIYFTDGFGEFPLQQPAYQVAFVYIDDGFNNPNVPVWAMKLLLKTEEIEKDI